MGEWGCFIGVGGGAFGCAFTTVGFDPEEDDGDDAFEEEEEEEGSAAVVVGRDRTSGAFFCFFCVFVSCFRHCRWLSAFSSCCFWYRPEDDVSNEEEEEEEANEEESGVSVHPHDQVSTKKISLPSFAFSSTFFVLLRLDMGWWRWWWWYRVFSAGEAP